MLKSIRSSKSGRTLLDQVIPALMNAAARLTSVTLSMVFGILAARMTNQSVFGAYVSMMAFAGLASVVFSAGLPGLILREVAASRSGSRQELLRPLAQVTLLTTVFGMAVVLLVNVFEFTQIGLVLLFSFIAGQSALLVGAHNGWDRVVFATWADSVFRQAIAIISLFVLVYAFGSTPAVLMSVQIVGASAAFILLSFKWDRSRVLGLFSNALKPPLWSSKHFGIFKSALVFGGGQLLINAMTQVDIVLLALMSEPEEVSLYYAAARAALVVSFLFGATAAIAEPRIARYFAAKDTQSLNQTLKQASLVGISVTLVCSGFAVLLGPTYLRLYGSNYLEALPVLYILIASLVVWASFGPVQATMRAIRLERLLLLATAIGLFVNIILSVALIPLFHSVGAAIGTAVQFLVYGVVMTFLVAKKSKLRPNAFSSMLSLRREVLGSSA